MIPSPGRMRRPNMMALVAATVLSKEQLNLRRIKFHTAIKQ